MLLDECVDWRLSREIVGHDVKTARQMGWATIKNGEWLKLAAEHFDVFNLSFQQNVACGDRARGEIKPACRPEASDF